MDKEQILKSVADNQLLLTTLREIIEDKFSIDDVNTNMTDDNLGMLVRARLTGLKAIDEAFKEIERYKTVKVSEPQPNPAR